MADFSIAALASEINTDPLAIGYKTGQVWKGDDVIAGLMNVKNRTLNRSHIKSSDVRSQTPYAAFDGLTAGEEAWLQWMTQGEEIAVTADSLANLAGIGGTSKWVAANRAVMDARMVSLMQYTGSRGEMLWGQGFEVTESMVGQAANV